MGGFSCRIFNAGNTHVQIAELAGDSLRLIETVPTAEFRVEDFAVETMAAASVVPDLEERFRKAGAFIVSSRMANCPVDLSRMEHAETLGADRLANAASLIVSGSLPALCVDFGTAINLEFVDADRCMCGGAIFPGRRILRRSLNDYTAKLPVTPLTEWIPDFPGNNTVDAINLGVDCAALGAVKELLRRMEMAFPGEKIRRAACGGDAPFFLRELPGFELADTLFTLRGIAALARCGIRGRDWKEAFS